MMNWIELMNAMEDLVGEDGGSLILTNYDWKSNRDLQAAREMVQRLQACKEAQKATQVLGEKFIDKALK